LKICFIPLNLDAAGCYRCIFPMAYLGTYGWETSMPAFQLQQNGQPVEPLRADTLLGKVPPGFFDVLFHEASVPLDADIYVFQHGLRTWQLEWARKLREQNPAAKILLDLDDDFHRVPKYNPAKLDPGNNPDANRGNVVKFLKLADGASFATPALRDFYQRWNPNTTVIGNYLHWPMWAQLPPVHARREWKRFRVGYMGRAEYHSDDVRVIAAPLRKWLVAHPDVEFVAAGDPSIHDIIGVPEGQRVSTSVVYFRGLDLPYVTSCFDVGLVPLVRNEFNEGKSWLKGLEYAACGIPSIASPTQPYRAFIEDGVTGRLAAKPGDFIDALDDALDDLDKWRTMGVRAHHRAADFSLDNRIGEWIDWYSRCYHAHGSGQGVLAGAVS
jgi:glycosyltransferase involved in cell wall biosynthesis